MKPIVLAVASLGSLLLAPTLAAAGPKVAVDFLCGVYAHDEITDLVPSEQAPKIDQPVACVVHLSKAGSASYHASITTVRHLENPTNGDHTDVTSTGITGDVTHKAGTDGDDLEVVMTPGQGDANGDIPFDSCETFDIVGRLTDDRGEVWSKTLRVEQHCPAPAPEPRAAEPDDGAAPHRQIDGRGSGNPTADDLLPGSAANWVTYMAPHGKGFYLAVGGCDYGGTSTTCFAKVLTTKGKVVATAGADIDDPMNDDGSVDYTELDLARADLDKALGHEEGWQLTAHDLMAAPIDFGPLGAEWNAKKNQLTLRNNGKVWKKVKTPKAPRGTAFTAATMWFMEGGDPMFAMVKLTAGEIEGIDHQDFFLVVPLPEISPE